MKAKVSSIWRGKKTLETAAHNIKEMQKVNQRAGVGVHTSNPSTARGQRQTGLCDFETTMVCLVLSQSEPRDPVSQ